MSKNQEAFVRSAKRQGLEVHDYSGRGMFGRRCPSVHVNRREQFKTRAAVQVDSLGLGVVVYAAE